MNKYLYIPLVTIIMLGAAYFLKLYLSSSNVANVYTDQDLNKYYNSEKLTLEKLTANSNPSESYVLFKREYEKSDSKKAFHLLAHWIGSQLYEKAGWKAMAICDDTAGYGCYHGLIGSAYAAGDLISLHNISLDNICDISKAANPNKEIECAHGFGHGLLSLNGYSTDGLMKAIDGCHEIAKRNILQEVCIGGVFMEYNLRTMEIDSSQGFHVRELTEFNTYSPCDSLDKNYDEDCYKELAYWWFAQKENSVNMLIGRCEKLRDNDNKKACVAGIGLFTPWVMNYEIDKIIASCGLTIDNSLKTICSENAGYRMAYKSPVDSIEICSALVGHYKSECENNVKEFICINLKKCE